MGASKPNLFHQNICTAVTSETAQFCNDCFFLSDPDISTRVSEGVLVYENNSDSQHWVKRHLITFCEKNDFHATPINPESSPSTSRDITQADGARGLWVRNRKAPPPKPDAVKRSEQCACAARARRAPLKSSQSEKIFFFKTRASQSCSTEMESKKAGRGDVWEF